MADLAGVAGGMWSGDPDAAKPGRCRMARGDERAWRTLADLKSDKTSVEIGLPRADLATILQQQSPVRAAACGVLLCNFVGVEAIEAVAAAATDRISRTSGRRPAAPRPLSGRSSGCRCPT